MSMDISSRAGMRFLSSAVIKCGGLATVTPGTQLPSFARTRTRCAGMLLPTQPPSGRNFSVPFGRAACTMKPTSSECASSCTTGLPPCPAR